MKRMMFLLSVVLMLGITACGGSSLPSVVPTVQVAGVNIDVQQIIASAREYYAEGVEKEENFSNLHRAFEQRMNTVRTTGTDLINNNAACFANVADTESVIAAAVMGQQDSAALVSALSTGSVSGEQATAACVQLQHQFADYIIANRQAVQDSYNMMYEAGSNYRLYFVQYPEIDWMNDLLQTYLNTRQVYTALSDAGIGVSDWSWLPTAELRATHRDEALCRYYLSGEFMPNLPLSTRLKFTGHEESLAAMYEVSWNPAANRGQGECTMTRMAALEYMMRSILSEDTRDVIESGEDRGLFPTPTPAPQGSTSNVPNLMLAMLPASRRQ